MADSSGRSFFYDQAQVTNAHAVNIVIEVCFCYSGNFKAKALGIIAKMFNNSADPQGWLKYSISTYR